MTIAGWVYQSFRSARESKEARLKAAEDRINELDKIDTKVEESMKRVHDRIDDVERSQSKLEVKIDNDIQDVKHSIDRLTDLVIQALQGRGD